MIPDIIELNFPKKDGKQYATLTQATANIADMGEKTITTQVKIDGEIVPDFSQDWEVEFQGEKYIMPLRIPQGAKENESLKSQIDLTFQHWAIYQLKRWPFVTIQQIAAGTYLPDEEVATVQLNLKDFCILFGQVLEYYYGDTITIDLNPAWQYKQEATIITISHTKIWNVLIDAFHDKYGVRWEIKAASDNSNTVKGGERYVIRVGYPTTEVDHIFEYGFEGGLLKVERQVQSEEIRNMLKGRGGDTNIPLRYFKNTDPNNKDFRPDPDWVEELANIYFPNLMPATFRSYVQGWKAAHINQTDADGKKIYAGYTPVGEANAYAPWAYRKGYTDTKFHPVEFVADEITINPATGDKQVEILPGYSPYVKKGSSLDKYGPLPDTLDNNEDIYPTLQGTGLDIAVAVEEIKSDDVAESTESDATVSNVGGATATAVNVAKSAYATLTIRGASFTVPTGKTANFIDDAKILSVVVPGKGGVQTQDITTTAELTSKTVNIYNSYTGEKLSASGIQSGTYFYEIVAEVHNMTTDKTLNITVGTETPELIVTTVEANKWRNTFDIWVKNIWGSTKLSTETDTQYAERVWKPVLGDREKNTAKVVFTSGALVHEDYEFTIVDFPVRDTSKTWEEKDDNGVVITTHTSHWRITLAKSDAELEATGLYVPSTKKQGKAGDAFVFIGTEMTHVPYVTDAEIRLDDWKKDQLGEKKEIKPTAVVTTDRVRLNNEGKPNALINQLRVGNSLRLFDKRFFNEEGKAYETLYLQSITYTYREPTSDDVALNPDVEIVLGNEYTTSANPVSMMQGEISALQRQMGAISNIQQIVRAVGDRLYLRKDGISDRSLSPTQFFSLLTSGDFRAGLVGGAGWGFYKDENGDWVLEADRLKARQDFEVNTIVINQAEGRGGMEIDTAAFIKVTRVVETSGGYVCYFDQKSGSVANLFHIDDVAFCNQWTAENNDLKFYKRRVTAVGADSVTLSKTDVNGTGVPAEGDNIIHLGNYTDKTRQYVKVRDVVGGGYERYIEELNSVNAAGVEYYFVGKQAGESRWFVGNKDLVPYSGKGDGSYIEYINRKFNLNNVSLSVSTTIGDKTIDKYISDKAEAATDKYKYLAEAWLQDTEIIGGLMLSTLVSLGYKDSNGVRRTLAGMNGAWMSDLGGRTIGSWWGGDMIDRFDANDNRLNEAGKRYATALIRMDGSAYFANGNIGFKKDGSGWLGNDLNGIKFEPDSTMTFGSGIKINVMDSDGVRQTLEDIANFNIGLTSLLKPYDAQNNPLTWAEATQSDGAGGIKAKSLRASITIASSENLVAYQNGSISGSGGGGIDLAALESYLTRNGYATQSWVSAHFNNYVLTKAAVESVLTGDIATHTHSQYLTSHQAVSNKAATLAWNTAVTVATVGNTNITVKLPTNPNTDTKNTAGSTDTSSKIFLIGATTQGANPQTYSHDTAYVGADGCLYSGGAKVLTAHQSLANYVTLNTEQTITGAKTFESKNITIKHPATTGGTAIGVDFKMSDGTRSFEFGSKGTVNTPSYAFIGWGDNPWDLNSSLAVCDSFLRYKGKDILHTGNYASTLNSVYLKLNNALSFALYTDYVAARFSNADLAAKAADTYIEFWQNNKWFNFKIGSLSATGSLTASSFIKSGGTSAQFLKADGSVDSTMYAPATAAIAHYGNTTIHITAAERTKWNKVVADFAAITGTDSDTIINKWEEVIAFLATYTEADTLADLLSHKVDKVPGYGLSENDFTDALLSKLDGIEAGANKYVHPTATAQSVTAANGKVLSAITVNGLGHVTSVASKTLAAADIPNLPWSKITSGKPTSLSGYGITDGVNEVALSGTGNAVTTASINGHKLTLTKGDTFLTKAAFDELFEKVTDDANGTYIRAKYTIASDVNLVAYQNGSISGSGGGGIDLAALESYLTKNGYATQSWVSAHFNNYVLTKAAVESVLTGDIATHTHSQYALASALSNYVTALGTSGDYLTWTRNGAVSNITVPYATNSSTVGGISPSRIPYGDNGTATTDLDTALADTIRKSGFYRANSDLRPLVIHSSHSTNTYAFQLGTTYSNDASLYIRHLVNNVWGTWATILDTKNYANILDSRYYTETEINTKLTDGSVTKVGTATVGGSTKPIYLNAGTPTACTYSFGNGSGNAALNNGTVNTNLNADMLDGYHAGINNGNVAIFVDFPTFNTLINLGYLESNYADLGYPDEKFLQAICKWAIVTYPGGGVLTGRATANSEGYVHINLYSSGYDSATGLPRYCSGTYYALSGSAQSFGTQNYQWRYGGRFAGNADTLSTARILTVGNTGKTFNGSANVAWSLAEIGAVNKAGDTMTGNLTLPAIYIKGTANSNAFITADAATNAYLNVNNKILMVWDGANSAVRSGNSIAGTVSLGTAACRWANLYATTINVTSSALVSNLNADMLDGAHADDIRKTVLAFKVFTGTSTTGGYDLNTLAPDGGLVSNYGSPAYWTNAPAGSTYGTALHIRGYGNLGGQFFADINHNSSTDVTRNLWWRASGTVNNVKTWGKWHQIAFTDSNVASATKLATARTINGTLFDGTANITTAKWGAARSISITDAAFANEGTSVNVDGSSSVQIPLPSEITATLYGNATTASALQTARTIWGQSFKGDGNVTGALSAVTDITMSGAVHQGNVRFGHNGSYAEIKSGGNELLMTANGQTTMYVNYRASAYSGTAPSVWRWYAGNASTYASHVIKSLIANGAVQLPYAGGSYLSMATRADLIKGAAGNSTNMAHALMRIANSSGSQWVIGGIGKDIGIYGFNAEHLAAGLNYFSWQTVWNVDTGELTHTGPLTVQSLKIGNGTITWDAENNVFVFSHTVVSNENMVAYKQ